MSKLFHKEDIVNNKGNTKGLIFIILFRISNFCTKSKTLKIIGLPFRIFYRIFVQWILGIDVPDTTNISKGLKLYHGVGLVINEKTLIGSNVTLRHNTTIGNASSNGKCPRIYDNVNIGANCVIIGDIEIGENSIVGAGSIVISNLPPNCLAVGNPAKIKKFLN